MFTFSAYPSVSFWEITKNMLFFSTGNLPPQEQTKPLPPGQDKKEEEEQQQQQVTLLHGVNPEHIRA